MSRDAFRILALVGGSTTLATYAWLAFGASDRTSVFDTIGGLFDTTAKKYSWLMSTALAAFGIGSGLALISFQDATTVENWDFMVVSTAIFFVFTNLWAPVAYLTSKNRWNRWLPALPVWGTALGNALIMANLQPSELVFWLLFVGLLHHVVMDGILWVLGYVLGEYSY